MREAPVRSLQMRLLDRRTTMIHTQGCPQGCWGLPHCFSTGMPQTLSWIGLEVQLCVFGELPPSG